MSDISVEPLAEALLAPDVRIDFGQSLSMSQGLVETARVWSKGDTTKRHALPLLLPPEGQGRAALLRMFADMIENGA